MTELTTITLNNLDCLEREAYGNTFNQMLLLNSDSTSSTDVASTVNKGGTGDGFMMVTLRSRAEFLTYHVLVAKIRRESAELKPGAPPEKLGAWCSMSQAFLDKFGVERTPPDIVKCLSHVRSALKTVWINSIMPEEHKNSKRVWL